MGRKLNAGEQFDVRHNVKDMDRIEVGQNRVK
jgi:hypothetical protein